MKTWHYSQSWYQDGAEAGMQLVDVMSSNPNGALVYQPKKSPLHCTQRLCRDTCWSKISLYHCLSYCIIIAKVQAKQAHQNDFVLTSMRRHHVISMSERRHFKGMCPLGYLNSPLHCNLLPFKWDLISGKIAKSKGAKSGGSTQVQLFRSLTVTALKHDEGRYRGLAGTLIWESMVASVG